ncbi:MAG: ParB/RepB/Spo0J family partition protein [Candidatus Latescibacteria bacterium]|mgnify:FL=1|jgi:ParB family transcriptional regulator, chromosome partitioning protein|nr:ParB/RepB/Spo0J family partition protein [Candidatus Latescibacterota bacterium]MBT5828908.1 ParB/RepB/Spo0J family partition protein [Candidatus Latescibacterota bacterium]
MPDTLTEIPIGQIDDQRIPLRERPKDPNLNGLMHSIQRFGLIEPVVVAPAENGYQLVVGRRRLEACRQLGLSAIPAIVRRLSAERARELSYQSNLQIHPLNIADEVDFLRRTDIFRLPDADAAQQLGMMPEEVTIARRFNSLPPPIREAVRNGELDERRALALTRLARETDQTRMFRYIRENDPPITQLEMLIDQMREGQAPYI